VAFYEEVNVANNAEERRASLTSFDIILLKYILKRYIFVYP